MRKPYRILISIIFGTLVTACGGGGSSGGGSTTTPPPTNTNCVLGSSTLDNCKL